MAEQLGVASLQLDADLAPLQAKLADAEARVARSVAVMQAMADSLHGDLDLKITRMENLVSRGTAINLPSEAPGRTSNIQGGGVWGIRGPEHPGSMTNPIVTVLEAAKYTPLGSYAAAIGETNAQDTERDQSQSGLATAADMAALTSAIQGLADNAQPANQLATAGMSGLGEPDNATRTVVMLDKDDQNALRNMAAALERMESTGRGPTGSSGRTIIVDHDTRTVTEQGPARTIIAGPGGGDNKTLISGPAGGNTFRLDGGQYAGLITAITESGKASDRVTNIFRSASASPVGASSGGGGGSDAETASLLGLLGFGGGHSGGGSMSGFNRLFGRFGGLGSLPFLAHAGTLGGFAGGGLEHYLFSLLGIAGSGASALGGAGLLAAGSLGSIGVGAGSDVLASKTAVDNAKNMNKQVMALDSAVAKYGADSTQATKASDNLNKAMAAVGNQGAAQAEVGLDQSVDAIHKFYLQASGPAQQAAATLMNDIVRTGFNFVPLVAEAAQRNLTIIDQGLKPLFSWLDGPQGIQLFQDLENVFAEHLPVAVHAFDQALEVILRVVDIAAQDTGTFVDWLNKLFTRLNTESNTQLSMEVNKLVGDFRTWSKFVKLLIGDIHLLFTQDVGTGSSIIQELTVMLQHVKAYEESTRGQANLQNLFEEHKTEILELINTIGKLSDTFGSVYMALAPPLVNIVNTVVLPVLNDVAKVIDAIAHSSGLAATAIGLLIVSMRTFGTGATFNVIKKVLGIGAGSAGAAEAGAAGATGLETAGAAGAGAAGGGLIAAGTAGIENAGLAVGGLLETAGAPAAGAAVVGGAAGVAAAAAAAVPIVLGGAALATILNTFGTPENQAKFRSAATGQEVINPRVAPFLGPHAAAAAQLPTLVTPGNVEGLNASALQGQTIDIKKIGDFSNYSAAQLSALLKVMKEAGAIKVNGVAETAGAVRALGEGALTTKDILNNATNEVNTTIAARFANMHQSLASLKDDWSSSWKLIAHIEGVNSTEGLQAVASATSKMVTDLTQGMLSGKVSVSDGMKAMNQVLSKALQDGAITWQDKWDEMFNTVTTLYSQNKISLKTYLSDSSNIMSNGMENIRSAQKKSLDGQLADLKQQQDDGIIKQQQYNTRAHALREANNDQTAQDMAAWVSHFENAMQVSGALTAKGMQLITTEVNKALGLFGANRLPIPEAVSWAQFQVSGGTGQNSGAPGNQQHATGGLVGQWGERGPDNVPIVVGRGEAVLNHDQQKVVNSALQAQGMSGLAELFATVNTPHWMAQGGFAGHKGSLVTASEYSGAGSASGADSNTTVGFAELSNPPSSLNFSALGHLPFGTDITVTYPPWSGKSITIPKIDVGAGGPAIPPASVRAVDLTMPAAHELPGFSGLANVSINIGGVGPLTGGGGSSAEAAFWQAITSPKVSGGGAMGTLVQAAMDQITKAANKKGRSEAAQFAPVGGGGSRIAGPGHIPPGFKPNANSGVPIKVQEAVHWGEYLASLNLPYIYGGYWDGSGAVTGMDCSGFISAIMHQAGIAPDGHVPGGGFFPNAPGMAAGPGKYITFATSGAASGPHGHVMAEVDGKFFESSQPGDGPHMDSGWADPPDGPWRFAHPIGYGRGGVAEPGPADLVKGMLGRADPMSLIGDQPWLASMPYFAPYAHGLAKPGFAAGGTAGSSNAPYWGWDPLTNKQERHTTSQWNAIWNKHRALDRANKAKNGKTPPAKGKKIQKQKPPHITGSALEPGSASQSLGGLLGGGGPSDLQLFAQSFKEINGLMNGNNSDIAYLTGEFNYWSGVQGNDDTTFVVTQDDLGNAVTPYIDWTAVDTDLGHLEKMYSIEGAIKNDYQQVLRIVTPMVKSIKAAIAQRKKQIAKIKRTINANLRNIKTLKKAMDKHGISHAAKAVLGSQITALEAQNRSLGGSTNAVGSGGELGALNKEVSALNSDLGKAQSYLPGGSAEVQGTFAMDPGAPIGGAEQELSTLGAQIAAISPTQLGDLLAQANSQASSADNSDLVSLLEQQLQTSQEQSYVLEKQYGVLASATLPPFGGSFADGGTVPGPPGAARTIIAHGGEVILNHGQQGSQVHVSIAPKDRDFLNRLIDVRVDHRTRTMARKAGRLMPSRGGGQLVPS